MNRIATQGVQISLFVFIFYPQVILVLVAVASAFVANGSTMQYRNAAMQTVATFSTMPPTQDTSSFIYISFAGRRYFKQAMKSEYIIETYRLPVAIYYDLKKATSQPAKDKTRKDDQISRILYPYQEEIKTYGIKHQVKFKQFYPRGLQSGDFISEKEFDNWNFIEPFYITSRILVLKSKPDSMALISYFDSIRDSNLARINNNPEHNSQPEVFYRPWDRDYITPYRKPVLTNMMQYVTGLMKDLTKYSPCLGAQRIRFELYDNPILAAFYAEMYVHYVDSICFILKDSLKIKPGESERFIHEASSIIPVRFKYASNSLLWEGICKNKLDCDNTAYLVYDIGSKLGMEVSVVLLRFHAIALVGEYAYETTGTSYFHKKDLEKEYDDVFLISSNRDSINALVAIYELGNFLKVNGEYDKAMILVREGLKYFPDDPQLLQTMGDVFNLLEDYANAFNCYYRANQKLPNDLYIALNLNTTKYRLMSAGKNDLVLAIIKKYK